jgi:hypothetical protein
MDQGMVQVLGKMELRNVRFSHATQKSANLKPELFLDFST